MTEGYLYFFPTWNFNIFQYSQMPKIIALFSLFFNRADFCPGCSNFIGWCYLWDFSQFYSFFKYSQMLKNVPLFLPFFFDTFSNFPSQISKNFPPYPHHQRDTIHKCDWRHPDNITHVKNNIFLHTPTWDNFSKILTLFFRFCKNWMKP